eukprot:15104113-Alexandrium_andersonii.AAC.1
MLPHDKLVKTDFDVFVTVVDNSGHPQLATASTILGRPPDHTHIVLERARARTFHARLLQARNRDTARMEKRVQ